MALPSVELRSMMNAGVHFGHTTRRWNPKMGPYIFGVRNGIHIIDLQQTVPMLSRALEALRDIAGKGGRILFVGTRRQSASIIADAARECGQYYVNHRWLGGMLTNWKTISNSIRSLTTLEKHIEERQETLSKRELLSLTRKKEKLDAVLGGIRHMAGTPNAVVVFDAVKEHIAIAEARTLGIPVIAILDTNADPRNITYPIPGNDDALRALTYYAELFRDAIIDGLQESLQTDLPEVADFEGAPAEADAEEPATETNSSAA